MNFLSAIGQRVRAAFGQKEAPGTSQAPASIPPKAVFQIGATVEVVPSERHGARHIGVIRDSVWHYKDHRWNYYLMADGKKISTRYLEADLHAVPVLHSSTGTPIEYPSGIDYEWLALDEEGCVGWFTTGGSGPVPAVILENNQQVDGLYERILLLPATGTATMLVHLPRPDDFLRCAESGLYAYDWSDVHRIRREELHAYELLACPAVPRTISDLPTDLQNSLTALPRLRVRFRESGQIAPADYLQWVVKPRR